MTAVLIVSLTLVALGGLVVVLTEDPERQAVSLSVYGLLLVVLFVLVQAPDVALSQLAVGSVAVPMMVMLAVRKIRRGK